MAARPSPALMAAAEIELRRRRKVAIELPPVVVIPGDMSFTQWCEKLGEDGMKVDGGAFTLKNRPAMRFLYDLIPTNPPDAFNKILVLQKCAQVGFTVLEMLACIYMALKWPPGMYLPYMTLARIKSDKRFMPIVRTVPVAYNMLSRVATCADA